jgi:hypothetical protein
MASPPVASPPLESLTPLPEGPPADAEAVRLLEEARRLLKSRDPAKAVPLLEQASTLAPDHGAIGRLLAVAWTRAGPKVSHAGAALNHFLAE